MLKLGFVLLNSYQRTLHSLESRCPLPTNRIPFRHNPPLPQVADSSLLSHLHLETLALRSIRRRLQSGREQSLSSSEVARRQRSLYLGTRPPSLPNFRYRRRLEDNSLRDPSLESRSHEPQALPSLLSQTTLYLSSFPVPLFSLHLSLSTNRNETSLPTLTRLLRFTRLFTMHLDPHASRTIFFYSKRRSFSFTRSCSLATSRAISSYLRFPFTVSSSPSITWSGSGRCGSLCARRYRSERDQRQGTRISSETENQKRRSVDRLQTSRVGRSYRLE